MFRQLSARSLCPSLSKSNGFASHASPILSLSVSFCKVFGMNWQLSSKSEIPSLSSSGSQAFPSPSASLSNWSGFARLGQLSFAPNLGLKYLEPIQYLSLSTSLLGSSAQTSHASPELSPSALAWLALEVLGQLSIESKIPSPSWSPPYNAYCTEFLKSFLAS